MERTEVEKAFKKIFGEEVFPYDLQIRAWDEVVRLSESGGILRILAPTAGGKTEAAILPYITQWVSGEFSVARNLIYILPTRALVNKQAQRIEDKLVCKLGLGQYVSVRADHGDVIGIKPMLSASINVTTLDAFTYSYFAQRVLGREEFAKPGYMDFPAGNIASSLVIFDETQMYQDRYSYTMRVLQYVLKDLREARIPTLFITATMPIHVTDMLNLGSTTLVKPRPSDANKPQRGRVEVEEQLDGDIKKAISNHRKKILKERSLIICNTIERARNAYKTVMKIVEGKKPVILLHSLFTREAREKIESHLDENSDFILVATQVIEAGLDLSFGFEITEVAPLDALIQRVGRVARRKGEAGKAVIVGVHYTKEPHLPYDEKVFKNTCNVIRTKCDDFERALYDLDKTQALMKDAYLSYHLKIPLEVEKYVKDLYQYFSSLKLFSPPPELTVRVRPADYVTLIVVPSDLLRALIKGIEEKEKKEEIDKILHNIRESLQDKPKILTTELTRIQKAVREKKIHAKTNYYLSPSLIEMNCTIRILRLAYPKYVEIDKMSLDEKGMIKNGKRVQNLDVLLVSEDKYDPEIGLLLELPNPVVKKK